MKIFLSFIAIFISTLAISQPFEGKIVFSIEFPSMKDPQTAAMLPKEAVAYFKAKKSRMEMTMMMGMRNVTISDGEKNSTVVLMDMMGQKYAIDSDATKDDPKAKEIESKTKVTVTNETKTIAGYTCKKAIIEFPKEDNPKEFTKMSLWFTEDLEVDKGYVSGPMSKIKGSILEFSVNEGPMMMILTAKEVVRETVGSDKFVVPEGYKKMTTEELQKMMGGR